LCQPLAGSQYKEPGIYVPPKYLSADSNNAHAYKRRASYFPYIAQGERFIASEGTVTYMYQVRETLRSAKTRRRHHDELIINVCT
jgi:hypothetical protein